MSASAAIGLTPRMRDCLVAIERYIAEKRCSPSIEDLRVALKLRSKGRVSILLGALQSRGHITFKPRLSRTIALVAAEPATTPSGACWLLPPPVEAQLRQHCAFTGEDPASIVADAVALFLDDVDRVALP